MPSSLSPLSSSSWLTTLLLAALLALAFHGIARAVRRRTASRIARRRARRALAGETAAEALLEAAGYAIVDRQVRTTWRFACDDDVVEAELRCDLLVERGGAVWVAEVKTGDAAPRLDTAATRRQLLEYQCAYAAAGVVLVDVEASLLRVVDFAPPAPAPGLEAAPEAAPGAGLAVALAIGAAVGATAMRLFS